MITPFEGIRAVLFDLDGTLVETNIDFPLMKREMLALAEKYSVYQADLQQLDILSIVDFVVSRLNDLSRHTEAARAKQEAYEKLEQIELAHCQNAELIDGARELLHVLRDASVKVGIVTRNSRAASLLSLERAGISPDILLTRDDVQNAKPHPDHLAYALHPLGVSPEQTIMIGDHWMDVMAGKAAGTRTIGFLRPGQPADFFDRARPDLVIRSLEELLAYIKR